MRADCRIFLILFCFFDAFLFYSFYDTSTLYKDNDGIILLDSENIKSFLNYSSIPTFVEFYASWCGHCVSFSRVYKSFKKQVALWNVYIAAINCANVANSKVCDDYFKITAYPTFKLFDCLEDIENSTGINLQLEHENARSLRLAVASFLTKETKCKPPLHILPQLTRSFLEDFKKQKTTYGNLVIVIGPPQESEVADSLALDLNSCSRILVTTIDVSNTELVSLFGSYSSFAVIAVDTQLHINVISTIVGDYAQVRQRLYQLFHQDCQSLEALKPYLSTPKVITDHDDTHVKLAQTNEIHIIDLISGIGMSLRQEIPRQPFDNILINAIGDWITVLHNCVYWPEIQRQFLGNLKDWYSANKDTLTSKDWSSMMWSEEALKAFPLNQTWVTCKGSGPNFRGYPCSLWLTAHIMTINCENATNEHHSSSVDVLLALRGFITNFFGCSECREHFRELTRRVLQEVTNDQDAIFFLWSRHNMVNARLRLSESADPSNPKIQYPSNEACPDCRNVDNLPADKIFKSTPGYEVTPIKWNIVAVMAYLRNHYGPGNIRLSNTKIGIAEDLYDPSLEFARALEFKRR